ncbi:S41 family peptidase [Pseudoalteromonas sp. MMG022]|uniref:S41 family peptidase n=1 Tax=Pseudoalteromonas sp. MMG022 TaxID=2909978 RepID=UPI001EFFE12D|nr:S41 family peptidase [Pseudoalteromonas sp. MMG022]MCF6437676.1 S41 family peptidase [Pseudoalteromonas sp. MMG022]
MSNLHLAALLLSFLLAGCGGGGNDNSPSLDPQPTTPSEIWSAGVFPASSQYKDYCANPRQGLDPQDNEPYSDKVGSAMLEKLWLRSFSHETYLWYDELPDPNPSTFDSIAAYFNALKTSATTPSGKAKDDFHFSESYEDYIKEAQSGVVAGYGVRWAIINRTPPRLIRVAYTQDNSPAELVGLQRGDELVEVDGVDIDATDSASVATINAALQPALGTTHSFTFVRTDSQTNAVEQYEVSLTAQDIETTPVQNVHVQTINGRKVGYVQFNQFISAGQRPLINAFQMFENSDIDELVLDLRYNGGGLVSMAAQLGYMIAGSANTLATTPDTGRVFSQTIYNDKRSAENYDVTFSARAIDWSERVYTDEVLPSPELSRVYILTTAGTCSASELIINGLQGIDVEVVLIGDQTCGKPFGFAPAPNCGEVYYTIQFKNENAKGFGSYTDGFTPVSAAQNNGELGLTSQVSGCLVADDFEHSLGAANEALFSAALNYMDTGECPPVSQPRPTQASEYILQGPAISVPSHPLRGGMHIIPLKGVKNEQ